jgi:uncharacterized protein (UPF0210 family)
MSSRRDVISILGAAALSSTRVIDFASAKTGAETNALRVRTITAGVELSAALELDRVEKALGFLDRAKESFSAAGYEVQTIRVATNPVIAGMDESTRERALRRLAEIDQLVASHGAIFNIGPILTANRANDDLVEWSRELVRTTRTISFSTVIASPDGGVQAKVAATTAKIMVALCRALPDGLANFRFAAAANIPAGTPFFPVAWHQGAESVAIGMEAASVVERAFASLTSGADPTEHLRAVLNEAFLPVERLAQEIAQREGRQYLGIDTSPAPAKDRSIAAAIEALTRTPFGESGTLEACSAITAALKSVSVKTCGYSGLMLPVLEDPLLAQRAGEGRYTIRDLLLFSSVCGTGLDVVPIAGNTSVETIAALLRDIAALSARLRKPLSARLFLVPDKKAGDLARFTDPLLTDSVVMKVN